MSSEDIARFITKEMRMIIVGNAQGARGDLGARMGDQTSADRARQEMSAKAATSSGRQRNSGRMNMRGFNL